jgi:hypothetical protein
MKISKNYDGTTHLIGDPNQLCWRNSCPTQSSCAFPSHTLLTPKKLTRVVLRCASRSKYCFVALQKISNRGVAWHVAYEIGANMTYRMAVTPKIR